MKSNMIELTQNDRNAINRHRRNQKRKLARGWHGKLRRNDDRLYRKHYAEHVHEMVKFCCCQPPHDCPCESVLCGGLCDERGMDFDEEDEVEL